jgi:hypothetical protein
LLLDQPAAVSIGFACAGLWRDDTGRIYWSDRGGKGAVAAAAPPATNFDPFFPGTRRFLNVALAGWLVRRRAWVTPPADVPSAQHRAALPEIRPAVGADGLSDAEFEEIFSCVQPDVRDFTLTRPLALSDLIDVLQEAWIEEGDGCGKTHEDTSDEGW